MESGLGVPQTTVMVNKHRTDYGLPHVGKTCVQDTFRRMRPTLTKIKKRQQGNVDHKGWVLARANQTK